MSNRHPRRGRHATPRRRPYALAFASATCLVATGAGSVLLTGSVHTAEPLDVAAPAVAAQDRAAGTEVSRNRDRTPASSASALPDGSPDGKPLGASLPGSASAAPTRPATLAGLDQAQTRNAATIVAVARQRGMPRQAMVVALATAMQESGLHNLANNAVPESLRYPHEGAGADHDSVGLFQQRPSQGWGTIAEIMDPARSAALFLDRLAKVPGWQSLSVTAAAQAVQRSAYPGAYQRHETVAEQLADALG